MAPIMAIETLKAPHLSQDIPYFAGTVVDDLFPSTHDLLPQTNQLYELDLAYSEFKSLSAQELIERGAYFRAANGVPTYHYQICLETPNQVSASATRARKQFFEANVFAVGYATHGLFPYRGKFHPQMIKAVMNIIGLKPGELVLDPMVGCGTTCVEASIIGVNSIGIEPNPFACLMSRAKLGALHMDTSAFGSLVVHADEIAGHLDSRVSPQVRMLAEADVAGVLENQSDLRELVTLSYLDAVGYARRRKNKTPRALFPDLLRRYFDAVACFNNVRERLGLRLGQAQICEGDARSLELPKDAVDGIVFSPPYSFAIDYLENDRLQLEFLGADVDALKRKMVGLRVDASRGTAIERRVATYFTDMDAVISECARVLRPGRCCVIVIGSNTNQTGGVYLEDRIVQIGERHGLLLFKDIVREIEGIRNTMRDEHLLFLIKE